MKNTRVLGLFQFVLFALLLVGCASATDGTLSEEAAASESEALKGAAAPIGEAKLDADAGGCDAVELAPGDKVSAFAEFNAVLDSSIALDSPELAGNTCTRVCKCCKNNSNTFCCKHCTFCSGPIGVIDGVFAP